jgi:hypothetical protein
MQERKEEVIILAAAAGASTATLMNLIKIHIQYNYFLPSTSSFPDGIFNNTQRSTRGWKENNKRFTDEETRK